MREQPATAAAKAVRASQAQALHDQALPRRGSQGHEVMEILQAARAAGLRGLTRREIGERWEQRDRTAGRAGRRDAALVARVVNELIGRQVLKQLTEMRVCTVSGQRVTVVGLIDA